MAEVGSGAVPRRLACRHTRISGNIVALHAPPLSVSTCCATRRQPASHGDTA
jgi:hypothetical protein